jgi:hypothetical protein
MNGGRTMSKEQMAAAAAASTYKPDLDPESLKSGRAYGAMILVERCTVQSKIIHLSKAIDRTLSIVLSVGPLVRGPLNVGDEVIFMQGIGLEQKGPSGGGLVVCNENSLIWRVPKGGESIVDTSVPVGTTTGASVTDGPFVPTPEEQQKIDAHASAVVKGIKDAMAAKNKEEGGAE